IWRFAHDKLREGVLNNLAADARTSLHRRIGEAMEQIYPNATEQTAALAHHFLQGEVWDKAVQYLIKAGDDAARVFAYPEARVHYWTGRTHYYRNALREAIGYFQNVLAAAKEFKDIELLAIPASVLGRVMVTQGHYGKAAALLTQALAALEQLANWTEWAYTV